MSESIYELNVKLNPFHYYARNICKNPHQAHKFIMEKLFPSYDQSKRILFRVYFDYKNNDYRLRVRSLVCPDCDFLSNKDMLMPDEDASPDIINFDCKEGDKFNFNIKIYPFKRIEGKDQYIKCKFQRLLWFHKKAQENFGFILHDCDEIDSLCISSDKDLHKNTDYSVFEGELEVTDREKFIHAMINGVGRRKYLGLGMLIINK